MGEFPTGEAVQTLDTTAFDTVLTAIRGDNFQVRHDDVVVGIHGTLGSGGTKAAYDASVNGEHFALALPNTTDDTRTALDKWQVALHEPEATNRMREMGFMVN